MEGITAPLPVELLGLALAPDSAHVEYSPSLRPLEHAVLIHDDPAGQHAAVGTLSPSDCFPAGPAGPYVAGGLVGPNVSFKVLEPLQHSILDHADPAGQHAAVWTLSPCDCCPAGPAGPCVAGGPVGPDDCLQVMEPFEHLVPDHADPATVGPLEHSVLDMEIRNDNLDSSHEPQFGSDLRQSSLELEDAIRREVLMSRSMGRVSARDVNGLLLSPENACLGDKKMSLDEVRSEGLRQWNMDMDVEYQYEISNGLPVYYGGDMYDSEDSEEYDPLEMSHAAYVEDYNFDVLEGMELMTYTRHRSDGGEARIVNTVDIVPMCQTVSCVTRIEPDVSSDTSGTETSAVIEGSDIEDLCRWPDLLNEEDCSISNVGSSVDKCMSEQDSLSYVDVASIGDFDSEDSDEDIGLNSDEGSVAELDWNTWDEACALEFFRRAQL